jgi:hypothetical protein
MRLSLKLMERGKGGRKHMLKKDEARDSKKIMI